MAGGRLHRRTAGALRHRRHRRRLRPGLSRPAPAGVGLARPLPATRRLVRRSQPAPVDAGHPRLTPRPADACCRRRRSARCSQAAEGRGTAGRSAPPGARRRDGRRAGRHSRSFPAHQAEQQQAQQQRALSEPHAKLQEGAHVRIAGGALDAAEAFPESVGISTNMAWARGLPLAIQYSIRPNLPKNSRKIRITPLTSRPRAHRG